MFYLKLNTEFFTFHGGYLLNTKLYVSGVGFSVVGLDRKKKNPGFYRFQSFLFIAVMVISILPTIIFWEASIQNQSVEKILLRPLNTFKFWYEWGFSHIIHWVHYLFHADKSISENDDYVSVTGDLGKSPSSRNRIKPATFQLIVQMLDHWGTGGSWKPTPLTP